MRKLEPVEIKAILFYKEKLVLMNEIKFFVYIINWIFMFLERKEIDRELGGSPLIKVDDKLNKALFENILRQSQFPENEDLSIEYYKILRESQTKSTGECDKSDNGINNINNTRRESGSGVNNTRDK